MPKCCELCLDGTSISTFMPEILLTSAGARQVLVTVLDINDYRPRFTERVFNTSVFENEPSGTSVITVKANDLDEGENGVVLYRLLGFHSGVDVLIKASAHLTKYCEHT